MTVRNVLRRNVLETIALVFFAGPAASEPISVEYFADQKAFKSGATTTSPLSFELFSDDACTDSLSVSPVFVGDPLLQYYLD